MDSNPQIAFNNLPFLPPKIDFDDIALLKKVNSANIALSKLEGSSLAIPNRALLVEPLSVREAVASSGIENINTTSEDVFKAEVFSEIPLSREQKETLHYREALRRGYAFIHEKGFLNTNDFLAIQKILEPVKTGIRRLPGTNIKNSLTGEIIYTPPEGEALIRGLLKNYEDYYNDLNSDPDPLIRLAILHYQFEAIHPFLDGNGRTGRILMVLHLILTKKMDLPILFISGYINKNRSEYYRLLNLVTSKGDWKNWILYILDAVEVQAIETMKTVVAIREMRKKYIQIIKEKLPKIYSADLVDYLFANPFYSQQRLSQAVGKERKTAAKYLNLLVEAGLIDVVKHKRENVYFCKQLLKLLS